MEYTKWSLTHCSMAGATIETDDFTIQLTFSRPMPLSMCEANAQLIAAAPELYEALAKAQEDINWMLNNHEFLNPKVFDYIDKALAKANSNKI